MTIFLLDVFKYRNFIHHLFSHYFSFFFVSFLLPRNYRRYVVLHLITLKLSYAVEKFLHKSESTRVSKSLLFRGEELDIRVILILLRLIMRGKIEISFLESSLKGVHLFVEVNCRHSSSSCIDIVPTYYWHMLFFGRGFVSARHSFAASSLSKCLSYLPLDGFRLKSSLRVNHLFGFFD